MWIMAFLTAAGKLYHNRLMKSVKSLKSKKQNFKAYYLDSLNLYYQSPSDISFKYKSCLYIICHLWFF